MRIVSQRTNRNQSLNSKEIIVWQLLQARPIHVLNAFLHYIMIVELNDYSAIRMRGLPFAAKQDDIITFFKDYDIYSDSVKIGRNSDNTKTGEAAVAFKDEVECKRAFQSQQGKSIAHRWIELYQITYQDYIDFHQL